MSGDPNLRPADPPPPVPVIVPAPALPAWPPPTDPLARANAARGGTPSYSLPTPDPGPAVAAESSRPTPDARPAHRPDAGPTTAHSPDYRDWARDQRPEGTVYGGPEGHLTVSMPTNQVENSGSLTGHILAQGWTDTPTQKTNTAKVVIVLLIGLGILVAIGLLVVLLVGDAFSSLFDGLLSG